MHELKFTAALQDVQGCVNLVLLHTTGATNYICMLLDTLIAQTADVWSFEGSHLGIKTLPA